MAAAYYADAPLVAAFVSPRPVGKREVVRIRGTKKPSYAEHGLKYGVI